MFDEITAQIHDTKQITIILSCFSEHSRLQNDLEKVDQVKLFMLINCTLYRKKGILRIFTFIAMCLLFQLETKITEELNSLKEKISKMTEV